MADAEITRKTIIVVDSVGENQYKDMTFKDKEGKDYKISNKRVKWFEDKIVQGQAVELSYAMSSFGKEYIYSAELVKDGLPPERKPEPHPMTNVKPQDVPTKTMSKDDWAEKDRIERRSIERQVAVKLALEFSPQPTLIGKLYDAEVIFTWIDGGDISFLKEAPPKEKTGDLSQGVEKTARIETTKGETTEKKHIPQPLLGQLQTLAKADESWHQANLIAKLDKLSATKTPSKSNQEAYFKLTPGGIVDFTRMVEEAIKGLSKVVEPGEIPF